MTIQDGWHVERKIQLQHIDPWFSKKAELAAFRMLHHQRVPPRPSSRPSCTGHSLHLERAPRGLM